MAHRNDDAEPVHPSSNTPPLVATSASNLGTKCKMTGKDKKLYEHIVRHRNKTPRSRTASSKANSFINPTADDRPPPELPLAPRPLASRRPTPSETSSDTVGAPGSAPVVKRRKTNQPPAPANATTHHQSQGSARAVSEGSGPSPSANNIAFVKHQKRIAERIKKRLKSKKVTTSTRHVGCRSTRATNDRWMQDGLLATNSDSREKQGCALSVRAPRNPVAPLGAC